MGRPLNKKFFGALSKTGFQVGCLADLGAGNVACYIVRQKSNRKYIVADVATGLVRAVCKTVDGTPAAPGEMQVTVTPEGGTQADATITFDTSPAGVVTGVTLVDGGYGYWTGGTFNITVASDAGYVAGTEAVITYTVSAGSIASVSVTSGGTGYTADLVAQAVDPTDLPATAAPGVENAKIIRNNHVVTFAGNRYVWPAAGGAGSGSASGMPEATLQGS